jgi:hypothetical protein
MAIFPENAHEEVINKIISVLKKIHNHHPEAIFLTQTSATGYGFVIKEAWKKAYSNEKVPKILTIDVKELKDLSRRYNEIYDFPPDGNDLEGWEKQRKKLKGAKDLYEQKRDKLAERVKQKLVEYNINSIIPIIDEFSIYLPRFPHTLPLAKEVIKTALEHKGYDSKSAREKVIDYNLDLDYTHEKGIWKREGNKVRMAQGTKEITETKQRIAEYKTIGKEIGDKLHVELEKNKKLEQRILGFTNIFVWCGILFFLSINFTGNVIGNMTNFNSNILVAVLIVLGLMGIFFWMRAKKK